MWQLNNPDCIYTGSQSGNCTTRFAPMDCRRVPTNGTLAPAMWPPYHMPMPEDCTCPSDQFQTPKRQATVMVQICENDPFWESFDDHKVYAFVRYDSCTGPFSWAFELDLIQQTPIPNPAGGTVPSSVWRGTAPWCFVGEEIPEYVTIFFRGINDDDPFVQSPPQAPKLYFVEMEWDCCNGG